MALAANHEHVQMSPTRARTTEQASAANSHQLKGSLVTLLLYMNEIKQYSHQLSQIPDNCMHLQQAVRAALQHTKHVCTVLKQTCKTCPAFTSDPTMAQESQAALVWQGTQMSNVMFASDAVQKPLTKRQREALSLISEGCTNKQGALQMNISPRTFEDHRAQVFRKVGARNTADLIRKVLSLQIIC
jgi:DNA-binding NarL/FixJ family response regulator